MRHLHTLLFGWIILSLPAFSDSQPFSPAWQFDFSAASQPKLYWQTVPGQSYDLWHSDSLVNWTRVSGYPKVADSLSMEHVFGASSGGKGFFQIDPIDNRPPVVTIQYPEPDGFAIGRFADLAIELEDGTGIDPATIRLSIGDTGPLSPGAPGLVIVGNTITYDTGEVALGDWGETITATLVAKDLLGNTLNHTWSFRLERQPQIPANVFVFGSTTAQSSGQNIENTPTANLAQRFAKGPVRKNGGTSWTLEEARADSLIISYTGATAPSFAVGSLLCNLTPREAGHIFYRRLLASSDDPQNKRLTLSTSDVGLEEFIGEGSLSVSDQTATYETDEDGGIQPLLARSWETTLGTIGPDLSGEILWSGGGASIQLSEARWQLTPTLQTSLEMSGFKLQRFDAKLRGDIRCALVPLLEFSTSNSYSSTKQLANIRRLVLLGVVGVPPFAVPVWLDLRFNLASEFNTNATTHAAIQAGVRQNLSLSFGGKYLRNSNPKVVWERSMTVPPRQTLPLSYEINGSAGAEIILKPSIDVRVFSAAGVNANVDPRFSIDGNAKITNGKLESAEWNMRADADLNLSLSVLGFEEGDLPSTSAKLYSSKWTEKYPDDLHIKEQPEDVDGQLGQPASLSVVAVGPGGEKNLKYQWFHRERPLPGEVSSELKIPAVGYGTLGAYSVQVSAGNGRVMSRLAVVTEGLSTIPEGDFMMSDLSVYISRFSIGQREVTKALWDHVRLWAMEHGYSIHAGLAKGPDHPVCSVSWYDVVKWCNARSEMEGLSPSYRLAGNVFKSGENWDVACDWQANGYRLPTEAEWEKASLGGKNGRIYPTGNSIDHSLANFSIPDDYSYGFHPQYNSGGEPYTAPVGSFLPNEFGLYDMAGNLWEWCWNFPWGEPLPGPDPRGVSNEFFGIDWRSLRGGSWRDEDFACECSYDDWGTSASFEFGKTIGFRLSRSNWKH